MFQKATRNQISVAQNRYQGTSPKVLFVCSAGCLRSPTGANVGYEVFGWNTRSCGSTLGFAIVPITGTLITWADRIVFVNRDNYEEVLMYAKEELEGKEIQVLNIPDCYEYNNPILKDILKHQLLHIEPFVEGEQNAQI